MEPSQAQNPLRGSPCPWASSPKKFSPPPPSEVLGPVHLLQELLQLPYPGHHSDNSGQEAFTLSSFTEPAVWPWIPRSRAGR